MKKMLVVAVLAFGVAALYAGDGHKKGEHGKNCPAVGKKMAESSSVEVTGKLLCRQCNLHQSDHCEKVFQPSNDETKLIAVCPGSKVDLEKVSEEGEALLGIKGKMVKFDDGTEMLMIESATKRNS